jgi:hypothetical protein
MLYYDYIAELNQILVRNGFMRKFRYRIIDRISTLDMFETIDHLQDRERADQLYQLIYAERCKTSEQDKKMSDDLLWINDCLTRLGFQPCQTKTSALRMFHKHVNISLYDLINERYDKAFASRRDLIKALRLIPELRYPLTLAKQDPSLSCFLVKM